MNYSVCVHPQNHIKVFVCIPLPVMLGTGLLPLPRTVDGDLTSGLTTGLRLPCGLSWLLFRCSCARLTTSWARRLRCEGTVYSDWAGLRGGDTCGQAPQR